MWKLYAYVGPEHLAKHATSGSPRLRVDSEAMLAAWLAQQSGKETCDTVTVTFTVLTDGLWIADRQRCPGCGATNIVKESFFNCAVCGAELPVEGNFS